MSYEDQLGAIMSRLHECKEGLVDANQIINSVLNDMDVVRARCDAMEIMLARCQADLATLRAQLARPE